MASQRTKSERDADTIGLTFRISDVERSADRPSDDGAEASRFASLARLLSAGDELTTPSRQPDVDHDEQVGGERKDAVHDLDALFGTDSQLQRAIGRATLSASFLESRTRRTCAGLGVRNDGQKSLENVVKAAARALRKDRTLLADVDRGAIERWMAAVCAALAQWHELITSLLVQPEAVSPGNPTWLHPVSGEPVDHTHPEVLTQRMLSLLRSAGSVGFG